MSHSCTVCNKSFSTSSNRSRHQNTAHGPGTPSQSSIVVNGSSVMQHPLRASLKDVHKAAKPYWVKSLLENAQTTISPTPQRIIWCYGQWQPSYFYMMRTMPGIEFNQGIPDDIDKADYLDVSQRNLIVLDDLMAQSGKVKRIADLFTKRSHHRNLSIIYIVQNIFNQGKEMRNISLKLTI